VIYGGPSNQRHRWLASFRKNARRHSWPVGRLEWRRRGL